MHGCGISSYEGKKVTSITIDPVNNTATAGTVTIAKNTVQQFKVTSHYSDSTTADVTSSSTWTTSDSNVASISATGLATAVASSGACTISAKSQGMTASIQLMIKDLTIQSIAVSPNPASMNIGFTQQFTATGVFSDGTETISQNISSLATWSSSTISVATIDNHGVATAVSAGTTDITAQWTVTSPAATLTVTNLQLTKITITASGNAQVGQPPVQLTATGTFVDSSTADLTSSAAWSSSDNTVATVDSSGLLTPVTSGSVTISASAGGVTGSLQVIVFAAKGH
jgi:Bacterial Ig-like domain (group 2)